MNERKLLMASFLMLATGAAMQVMQTASAGELPESIRAFVAEQQTQIKVQGESAREAIMRRIRKDYEVSRLAFIENQERAMRAQAGVAIAAIKTDLDLIRFEGALARLMLRPERRRHPEPPFATIEKSHDR